MSTEQPDPLERACSLVGRFLSHGRLEQKIDQAVIKFSDLDERAAPMLGIIDFVRKLDLVRDCAYAHIGKNAKDKKFAATTYKRVQRINNHRRMIAHSSFEPSAGGGVQFKRAITKDGTPRPASEPWTDATFLECYAEMSALETELDRLIQLTKPAPFFDWSGGFQEMYHRRGSGFHNTSGRETPLAMAVAARKLKGKR